MEPLFESEEERVVMGGGGEEGGCHCKISPKSGISTLLPPASERDWSSFVIFSLMMVMARVYVSSSSSALSAVGGPAVREEGAVEAGMQRPLKV